MADTSENNSLFESNGLLRALSTGGKRTDNATSLMIDTNKGSNVEKLLTDIRSFSKTQTDLLMSVISGKPRTSPEQDITPKQNDQEVAIETTGSQSVLGAATFGALQGIFGDYAKFLEPLFEASSSKNVASETRQTSSNATPATLIDFSENSNFAITLNAIKEYTGEQANHLKQLADYTSSLQNKATEQSVSSAALSNRLAIAAPVKPEDNKPAGKGTDKEADTQSIFGDMVSAAFGMLGINTAKDAVAGLLRAALPRLIPAVLGPIIGVLTGPVGIAALVGTAIVGGAVLLGKYLKAKREEFITEIDKRVGDGIKEIQDEEDPGFFRSLAVKSGMVDTKTTTEDLIRLEQTASSYKTVVPRGAGRAPLTKEQMELSETIDWKRAEKDLDPETYKKLRGQADKVHQDIQTPGFLYHLTDDKLDLMRELSVLFGQKADVALIDKVKEDNIKYSDVQSRSMGQPVYDAQGNFTGMYDTPTTSVTSPTVPEKPISNAAPPVVIVPPAAAPAVQGAVNSHNTSTTVIQRSQDPAGTLMLQSQMLGGGYGDIPIFNWGN